MRKFSRSLLLVGALALTGGLAACGDDVTVAPPTPPVTPTPKVTAVAVAPSTGTVRVGSSLQLNASVTADSGATATIAWKTSDATIATVDATGKVTGVKVGTVGITATATANGSSASGSATIIVSNTTNVASIVLTPNAVTLTPGQTQGINATVTLDPNSTSSDKGVTWSTSDATKATVTSAGVVTAVAAGAATITATANADTNTKATVSVTIRQAVPTSISVQSITQTGNLGQTVNVNNVAGSIDVTLNVDPGENIVSRVEVLLDGNVVCSQTFSAAQNQALSAAAVNAAAAPVPVVCQINTARFNTTTGIADFLNGQRVLSARAITSTGSQVATPSTNLVFNNVNTFVATQTYTGTTAAAVNAAGLGYNRGGLNVSVLPVIYTPSLTLAPGASITFGGCDASGVGARTATLTAPAGGAGAWTATFAQTAAGGPAASNVMNYEYNGCGAGAGESYTVTGAGSNGNQLFAAAAPANATPIRLDNRAPGAPTFVANPNNRQSGWLNGSVNLVGLNTGATSNNWLAAGTADAGVGGYVPVVRIGAGPSVDAAIAATGSTNPAVPAPTASNTTDCAVISAQDLLGNESALPAAGSACTPAPAASFTAVAAQSLQFGVDIAPPTIAFSGGLASGARLNGANVGGEFQVTVNDTGTVGNSGMLNGSAVVGKIQLFNTAGTSCFFGTGAACAPASVNAAPAFPLVPTAGAASVTAQTTAGYYIYTAMSKDAAGNTSGSVSRVVVYDATAPALTTALFNTPLNGPTATFTANASDNLDLQNVTYTLTYGAALAGPLQFPAVTLNTFSGTAAPATLVNSNVAAGITINGFMRQVEAVTGNAPLAVSAANKPATLTGVALDQANNASGAVATAIPGASVSTGVSYAAAPAAQLIDSWAITAPSAATNISNGAGPAAAVNPTSVTLTAIAAGPTATFSAPFARVDFYRLSGGNLVLIGSATTPVTNDNGAAQGRTHAYSISWTPGATIPVGVVTIYAIGVNSLGDGLVTASNANITITNP